MPVRKTVFNNNCYYHIYNRGVEKRIIFQDNEDYKTFMEILIWYLVPDERKYPKKIFSRMPKVKVSNSISLLCYCLIPNHFHLLIEQKRDNGIVALMQALGTTYSMYFNRKNKRVGSLFQGRFKAKIVETDKYLLWLSKYIHLNPEEIYRGSLENYQYSSYRFYLHGRPKSFINTKTILDYFFEENKKLSYKKYVEEIDTDFTPIYPLLLE